MSEGEIFFSVLALGLVMAVSGMSLFGTVDSVKPEQRKSRVMLGVLTFATGLIVTMSPALGVVRYMKSLMM
jgi:hypothetical protein